MALISNVDVRTTPLQRKELERRERQHAFVKDAYAQSDRATREAGIESAPHRFWFQKDAYSYDSKFDESVAAVKNRTSLPIRERVTLPDGTIEKVLGKAALECVRLKIFCAHCEERQPDEKVRAAEQLHSLARMGVALPPGASPDSHCAYCAHPLGVQGDAQAVTELSMSTGQRDTLRNAGVNLGGRA